jgi:hypothetical protein
MDLQPRKIAGSMAIAPKLRRARYATLLAASGLAVSHAAHAQVGDARDALPGIVHVPVAGSVDRTGAALAASGGYGYTQGALGGADAHERFFGTIAGSLRPTPWLAFALRLDGRIDHDVDSAEGNSSGLVGDPRLFARIGTDLPGGLRIGAQLGVWLPGDKAPSIVFKATTLDLVALAAYAPVGSPVVLALHAGGRWDNSAATVPDAAQLSASSRLGLGINAASGVLSGLGVSYRVARRFELLADVSADWLVGGAAPPALESPIVAALGGRWEANERGSVSLELSLEASPSQRPDLTPPHPLVDVEPLFSASFGIVLRPGASPPLPAPEPMPTEEATVEVAPPPAPTSITLKGRVTSASGAPLAHAQVVVTPGTGEPRSAESGDDGSFELPEVPFGASTLDVHAQGYAAVHRDLAVDAASTAVSVALDPAIPPAQIRGLVRDFAGKPVAATVVIQPLGTTAAVKADGAFEIEVKPGAYDVVITAKGYAPQRRHVTVEPQGVTLLNVDLRGAR